MANKKAKATKSKKNNTKSSGQKGGSTGFDMGSPAPVRKQKKK